MSPKVSELINLRLSKIKTISSGIADKMRMCEYLFLILEKILKNNFLC